MPSTTGYGVTWKASGPITTVQWNGTTKLTFDGRAESSTSTAKSMTPETAVVDHAGVSL
ncbi:hypothetical protein ACIHDR_47940 [Nocardia sp. NPDC052278]|uniref:hypothetical protein n=1 Tax=unclassified Nocardia TaxID=2637762 RepID=UPI003685E0D1